MDMYEQLFGPLSRSYCDYFLYLTIFNAIIFAFVILHGLYVLLFTKKRDSLAHVAFAGFQTFVSYFITRLLYSMCAGSLK